ncbi:hypothetical protein ACFQ9U_28565 [Streptomyces sp. NPDC056568]|uniref:hypothetical protein n=1 Tax=Streptomyces sp. NPDC056568 TaxID=3345866 RepID=UPI003690E0B3
MKIGRWAAAVAVGGAIIGLAGCGDSDKPTSGVAEKAPAAAPEVQLDEMVKSQAAATRFVGMTTMQSYGDGCVNAYQCQAALSLLQPYATPLAEALEEEAGEDPNWKNLVDLAEKVSAGVEYTEPADTSAVSVLLKDVKKLEQQLLERDVANI